MDAIYNLYNLYVNIDKIYISDAISNAIEYVELNYPFESVDEQIVLIIAHLHFHVHTYADTNKSIYINKFLGQDLTKINKPTTYKKRYISLVTEDATSINGNVIRWDFNDALLNNISNIKSVKIFNFYLPQLTGVIKHEPVLILIKELSAQSFIMNDKNFHFIGNDILTSSPVFTTLISFDGGYYNNSFTGATLANNKGVFSFNDVIQVNLKTITLEFNLLDNELNITDNIYINIEIEYEHES